MLPSARYNQQKHYASALGVNGDPDPTLFAGEAAVLIPYEH
jgi:hypothetical protein